MTTKKHAVALQLITHADDEYAKDQVILGMDRGQFNDWELAKMVREATAEEVAIAKGEKPAEGKRVTAKSKPKASA